MATSAGRNSPQRKTELSQIPNEDWALAEARLDVVQRLLAAEKVSHTLVDAEAAKLGVTRYRVYAWLRRYRANPTIESLLPQRRGWRSGAARLPADVEAIIVEAIEEFYLTMSKPKLQKLVAEVGRRCRIAGINRCPDARSIKARVDKVLPSLQLRRREGKKAADDRYRPVIAEYTAEYALQVVQFDHTLVDVIVVDEVYRQPIQRPWLTLGVDVASSAAVGFYLTLEAPSALSVAMALTHAVLPKERWLHGLGISAPWPIHGLPDALHTDNGKEFRSRALERGCREYGINAQYRPRRTPHYGGHIERLIGTMMGEVHLLPGTTFSNIEEKGAYDPEKTAVMTLRELETWMAIQVIAYNGTIHRRHLVPPQVAYLEGLERRPRPVQYPQDSERFLLDFLPFEMRRIGREGIQLHNIHYQSAVLRAFEGDTASHVIKYDPRDLSCVYLLDSDGKYWTIPYRDLSRPRVSLWEWVHARKSLRERGRKAVDESMLFDAVSAQRMLVAEAAQKTKAARRTAQRGIEAIRSQTKSDDPPALPSLPAHTEIDGSSSGPVLPFDVEEWS